MQGWWVGKPITLFTVMLVCVCVWQTLPLPPPPCPSSALLLQLQHGFAGSDNVLHTDLLTDRMATEDYQRYRSATVMVFLGDEAPDAAAAAGVGSSSKNWSLVFPMARGGAWRGSAVPFEHKGILEQGQQVTRDKALHCLA